MAFKKKSRFRTWHSAHDRYERAKKKIKKALPVQESVKKSAAHRLFGSTLFRPELWSFKEEQMARGLALGLFVAFTPTIGFQMIITCFLILFIPGNLPIAIAACWITNPFTAAPIYYLEYKIGEWLVNLVGAPAQHMDMGQISQMIDIYDVAGAMWIGSLFVSLITALLGYWFVHGFVYLERLIKLDKIIHFRSTRPTKDIKRKKKTDQ